MKRTILLIVACALLLTGQAQAQSGGVRVNGVNVFTSVTIIPGGVLKLADGSAAAPPLTFTTRPGTGLYHISASNDSLAWSQNGTAKFTLHEAGGDLEFRVGDESAYMSIRGLSAVFTGGGVRIDSGNFTVNSNTGGLVLGSLSDLSAFRDGANIWGQRNGTSPQQYNLYETWTDASNNARLEFISDGSEFVIRTNKSGTGTYRPLYLGAGGGSNWQITTSGHFLSLSTNTYDIGTSTTAGAPRTVYAGTSVVTPMVNATTAYQVGGVSQIYYVTSNFTTAANTNLQTITGLVIPLPLNTALNVPIRCALYYSQATAAVADSFGLQTDTLTPTNFQAGGAMETALGTTAYGDVTIANTTATAVVTGTPGTTATIFNAYIDAMLENPSGAATNVNVMVKTSASADVITVYRGSFCRVF